MFRLLIAVTAGYLLLPHTYTLHAQYFERVDLPFIEGNIQSCSFVDINDDYLVDISASRSDHPPIFFTNQGGNFYDYHSLPFESNHIFQLINWVDYNNDSLLDLFVVKKDGQAFIYESLHKPYGLEYYFSFREFPKYFESANWIDIDQDGWLDLHIAGRNNKTNFIYRYDPFEGFIKNHISWESDFPPDSNFRVSWTDWAQNGIQDIFITSQNGKNYIFRNTGDIYWKDVTPSTLSQNNITSIDHHWVDYDNDGDQDLFLINQDHPNQLFRNDSYGKFKEITCSDLTKVSHTQKAQWADADNDGDLDVLMTCKCGCTSTKLSLHLNLGEGKFDAFPINLCALENKNIDDFIWTDSNLDGLQDIFLIASENNVNELFLYRNIMPSQNWLAIKCIGEPHSPPQSNRQAIGTKVYIKTAENDKNQWQMRVIDPQKTNKIQTDMMLHFGLGNNTSVKDMRVEWPSGKVHYFSDVEANHLYLFRENGELEIIKEKIKNQGK